MKLPKSFGPLKRLNPKMKRRRSPIIIRRVFGHSMIPILPPKTLVLGWAWTSNYKPGQIIIFQHDAKEKIKRISEVLGDGSIYVVGEHPETSTDSRQFGAIAPEHVLARIIWPTTKRR